MGVLALSRKRDERVVLIDEATGDVLAEVRIGKIKGNNVQLAIRGRADVRILRGELIDRASVDVVALVEPAHEPQVLDAPCLSPLHRAGLAFPQRERAG